MKIFNHVNLREIYRIYRDSGSDSPSIGCIRDGIYVCGLVGVRHLALSYGPGDKREDIGVMERFYWLMRQVWCGVVMAVRGLVERWEAAFRKGLSILYASV